MSSPEGKRGSMTKYDTGQHFSRLLHKETSLELGIRSKCMYIKGSKRERTNNKTQVSNDQCVNKFLKTLYVPNF
jgi:hypothetical protein